jgi:hypothetical protein
VPAGEGPQGWERAPKGRGGRGGCEGTWRGCMRKGERERRHEGGGEGERVQRRRHEGVRVRV